MGGRDARPRDWETRKHVPLDAMLWAEYALTATERCRYSMGRGARGEKSCAADFDCVRSESPGVSKFVRAKRMNVTGTIDAILNQKSGAIWSVSPEATVYDAIAMMAEKNVGALLVVQNEQLVGILSERDYTRKVMLRGKRSRETPVSEIMTTQLTTVDLKESVDDCLRFMTEKRIRHLPVVHDGQLRGVISIGDLVKHVISVQSATLDHLERYISGGYAG